MSPTYLFDLPHRQARALAAEHPVYLLVNPVEYHGPHLPLHTDQLISMGIARDLHARLSPGAPLLLGGVLEMGVEPVPGPGTVARSLSQVRAAVLAACEGLADLGARRVLIVTFHGAPLHNIALQAGVRRLLARGVRALAPLALVFEEMLAFSPETFLPAVAGLPEAQGRALIEGLPQDFHGGFFETSVLLHHCPEAVDPGHVDLPPCAPVADDRLVGALSRLARGLGAPRLSGELAFAATGLGWYRTRPFRGYTGSPHLARAEAGAFFAEQMAQRGAAAAQAVFDGAPPPEPILQWLGPLTLGGRLPGPSVPAEAFVREP